MLPRTTPPAGSIAGHWGASLPNRRTSSWPSATSRATRKREQLAYNRIGEIARSSKRRIDQECLRKENVQRRTINLAVDHPARRRKNREVQNTKAMPLIRAHIFASTVKP